MKPVQFLMRLSSNVRSSHYAENSFLYCLNLKLLHSSSSFGIKPGKPGRILQSFISHPVPTLRSRFCPVSVQQVAALSRSGTLLSGRNVFPAGLDSSWLLRVCFLCGSSRCLLFTCVSLSVRCSLRCAVLRWADMPAGGSSLFSGFRVLGLYSNHVPHALRYHLKHRESYVVTAVGRSFHTFNVRTAARAHTQSHTQCKPD